jgi:hypothetical protein
MASNALADLPCTSFVCLQLADAYIPGTVDALLHPEAPLALRLSGQLLLGVVRLFSRKVTFLHQVCAYCFQGDMKQRCTGTFKA